jgi:nicotinamide riboside kinase
MNTDINTYNKNEQGEEKKICVELARIIEGHLKKGEGKVWHRHPVWFLDGNPVVGYSKLKAGVRLMFWSGRGFDELLLVPSKGKFKDASITYTKQSEIQEKDIKRWLKKAGLIQWDYKNIVKRKGKLVKLKV